MGATTCTSVARSSGGRNQDVFQGRSCTEFYQLKIWSQLVRALELLSFKSRANSLTSAGAVSNPGIQPNDSCCLSQEACGGNPPVWKQSGFYVSAWRSGSVNYVVAGSSNHSVSQRFPDQTKEDGLLLPSWPTPAETQVTQLGVSSTSYIIAGNPDCAGNFVDGR